MRVANATMKFKLMLIKNISDSCGTPEVYALLIKVSSRIMQTRYCY